MTWLPCRGHFHAPRFILKDGGSSPSIHSFMKEAWLYSVGAMPKRWAGVDILDVATSALSGGTSQPSMTALCYALEHTPRQPKLDLDALETIDRYWQVVRKYYAGVDARMTCPNTTVFQHEMPGGQYSNLQQQAAAVGLGDRWPEVCRMYARVNQLFGDVIKVTPSSKVVGDMSLFMVQNHLTEEDIYQRGDTLDFPQSVVDFFDGKLGTPYGGFPELLQKIILRGAKPHLETPPQPIDLDKPREDLKKLHIPDTPEAVSSCCLYPKVYKDYMQRYHQYGGHEHPGYAYLLFAWGQGKRSGYTWMENGAGPAELPDRRIRKVSGGPVWKSTDAQGNQSPGCQGFRRQQPARKADPTVPGEVGATLSGSVLRVQVEPGTVVKQGDPLMVTEAMKMETTLTAPVDGLVKEVLVKAGSRIQSGTCCGDPVMRDVKKGCCMRNSPF